MLTSCGIAVICTVRAAYRPRPPPISTPASMTIQPVALITSAWMISARVVTTAMVMPATENWLPRRAVAGVFIRCRPSTKHDAAST